MSRVVRQTSALLRPRDGGTVALRNLDVEGRDEREDGTPVERPGGGVYPWARRNLLAASVRGTERASQGRAAGRGRKGDLRVDGVLRAGEDLVVRRRAHGIRYELDGRNEAGNLVDR